MLGLMDITLKHRISKMGLNGTSGILRVNQDGRPITPGILGNKFPLSGLLFLWNMEQFWACF
jgi:hypothetical protein